jgi:hypothetical protein
VVTIRISLSIVTRLWTSLLGNQDLSPGRSRHSFLHSIQTGLGPTQPPIQWESGFFFLQGWSIRVVKPLSCFLCGAIPPLPHMSSYTVTALPFTAFQSCLCLLFCCICHVIMLYMCFDTFWNLWQHGWNKLETSVGKIVGHFILTDLTEHFTLINRDHKGMWCSKDKVPTFCAEDPGLELAGHSADFSACLAPLLVRTTELC